jgi:subtilisin-like proprotein convertase family protein
VKSLWFLLLFFLLACNAVDPTAKPSVSASSQHSKIKYFEQEKIEIHFQRDLTDFLQLVKKPDWLICEVTSCSGLAVFGEWSIEYRDLKQELRYYYFSVVGDPLLAYSWYLKNNLHFSFYPSHERPQMDLNLDLDLTRMPAGSGVEIAVSDTGVDFNHADLSQNLNARESLNFAQNSNLLPYDSLGHGTAVTGIIAALAQNNIGSRGIAPGSRVRVVNFLDSYQTSEMLYKQAMMDVDIFNYSYGDFSRRYLASDPDYNLILKHGVEKLREGLGAIYIKAAGNEYSFKQANFAGINSAILPYNANLPQDNESPYMLVVGALNHKAVKASYSNAGSNLWVSAFGGEIDYGEKLPAILTTDISNCLKGYAQINDRVNLFEYQHQLNPNCDFTSTMNGTSAATPMVTGAVALMLEVNPYLSWRDVKYILAKTARKVDVNFAQFNHPTQELDLIGHQYEMGWTTNAAGFHFHNWYGFGLLDINAAVDLSRDYFSELSEFQTVEKSWSGQQNIQDANAVGAEIEFMLDQNMKIEHVQLQLQLRADSEHFYGWPGEVGVQLISPNGTKSIMLNINNSLLVGNGVHLTDLLLLSNAFYQEQSIGVWKLKIVDGFKGQTGKLMQAKMLLYGGAVP